jgi:hypothetical protein
MVKTQSNIGSEAIQQPFSPLGAALHLTKSE